MEARVGQLTYLRSPSAWRAWIEMLSTRTGMYMHLSRPPHGGRGLKSEIAAPAVVFKLVALRMEGVD